MRSLVAVSAYYFLLFAGIGLFWPNYGPFLAHLGVGPAEVTFIMAMNPLMGLIVPPAIGLIADARRAREWILTVLSAIAALVFLAWTLELRARGAIYAIALIYALARAPLSALADVTAFDLAHRHGTSFGRLRLWGSVGFLLAAAVGGIVLERGSPRLMVGLAALGLGAAAACAALLPAPPLARREGSWRAWRGLLARRDHQATMVTVFFAYVGSGALDGCFSLHLLQLGHGASYIGGAWAFGVLSEVLLMHRSSAIIAAVGAERLLALAQATAALRWLLIATITNGPVLFLLQPLHGISFGLTYVAAATITRRRAPEAAPTAAQGLFTAVASAGSFLGMTGGGQLLARVGGQGVFLAATGCAVIAAVVAFRKGGADADRVGAR